MRRSRNRRTLQVDAMETKVVLSALAPAPAVEVEMAVAKPLDFTRDTVRIQNNTDFKIHVTAHFGSRSIPEEIGKNGGIKTFSFKTNASGFIKADIKRADGKHVPPAYNAFLIEPMDGYYGALYKVSEFGRSFNVST